MRMSFRIARHAAGSLLLLALASTAVMAYSGQVAHSLAMRGPSGDVTCNSDVAVSTTVLDANGSPISAQPVTWAFAATDHYGDTVDSPSTTTNASGVAATTVRLACVAGQRQLEARADDATAAVVLGVQAAGLPRTDTSSQVNWTLVAAVIVAITGLLLATRRVLVRS